MRVVYQVVLDTNVLVAALRSKRGASYRLLRSVGDPRWQVNVSVALVLEYEAVLKRESTVLGLPAGVVDDIVDMMCAVGRHCPVYYRWRPFLQDPGDEFILDLAVGGRCGFIVTHNTRDFAGVEQFGIRAVTPREFLGIIEEIP
jgi:putative PIN family toxin of toxin-antitoxin system